jgi:hypothetical protein
MIYKIYKKLLLVKENLYQSSFGKNKNAIWGCQLFDNETKARKSFG